ncbi:MAG: phenylacetate-CoA oxygenase subunit PaaC [Chitinophagaceae bacterium]
MNITLPSKNRTAMCDYVLQMADSNLILAQRLCEWCGHGPILEQDIALSNIGLDLLGATRSLYQYAAQLQNENKTEDDLAFLRGERDFRNFLICELPKGDFGFTVVRQFLFEAYQLLLLEALQQSSDTHLAAIAEKSHKEALYHYKWSAEWGDPPR